MSLVSTLREVAVALDEIKALRNQITRLQTSHEDLRNRIAALEQGAIVTETKFDHLVERTKIAAEAGISVAIARSEGDLKAKLVELDLRLQAVERATGNSNSPRQLPPA